MIIVIKYKLYEAMEGKDISIRDLARKSGVSKSQIERIIDGRNTTVETLYKLSKALGVPITDLFSCED